MAKGALKSAVFRFSNQDGAVVPLHLDVLKGSGAGYVWWGWWKKEHEPGREATLEQLSSLVEHSGSTWIALLNRKDDEFFKAEVDLVQYPPDGERSMAPDSFCPDLYRAKEPGCAAWLRLRRIVQISAESYAEQFGVVPTGDPTLYEIREESGKLRPYPSPSWDMREVALAGDSILHLSDLHFGESHGYLGREARLGAGIRSASMLDRVTDAIDQSKKQVGLVVVSGDLVSKATTDDFFPVEDFLTELLKSLRLSKRHLVVVPGNHDFKTLEALDKIPTMDYGHERAYRTFCKSFFDWREPELERLHHFVTSSGERLVLAGLNSARLRGKESKEYGYVGRHRYAEMLDHMEATLTNAGVTARKVAVLHHHVLPVQELELPRDGVPVSITVDAAELYGELQERGFDAILHGHQHRPFFFRGGRATLPAPTSMKRPGRQLIVVGNGSSGAARAALHGDFPFNSLGIHGISGSAFSLSWYFYSAEVAPQTLGAWDEPWQPTGQ